MKSNSELNLNTFLAFTKCPEYQPYALANGHFCCAPYEKDNSAQCPANGNTQPQVEDPIECCANPVPCGLDEPDTCQNRGSSKFLLHIIIQNCNLIKHHLISSA